MAQAVLVHLAVTVLAALAMCLAAGQLTRSLAALALLLGAAAGLAAWRAFRRDTLFAGLRFWPALFYAFILYAALQHFLYLLYDDQHGLKTLHANNFGDLPFHLQYIRHLAAGVRFWPDNPGFAGHSLVYPLGMDLYNALWEILGVPADSHLFVTGLGMSVITLALLHRWLGWWGCGAFFLNGGLANWRNLASATLIDFQSADAWQSLFLSTWITQRGFLFALPAGLFLLRLATDSATGKRQPEAREQAIGALLWGSLAWFHIHSYFILSIVLGLIFLAHAGSRHLLARMALPAALLGLPFVWFATGGLARAGIAHVSWNWMAGEENPILFWLRNFGPWLPYAMATAIFLCYKPQVAHLRRLAVICFGLFFVFSWLMVAPWDWDNIKVLLWLYLLGSWLIWQVWLSRLPAAATLFFAVLSLLSGTISVLSSLPAPGKGVELLRTAEAWEAKAALQHLPAGAVLAVAPEHNHPAIFWGAGVAMGYAGHLWSHGIDYQEREALLDRLFRGDPGSPEAASRAGISHIWWSRREKERYGFDRSPWQDILPEVSGSPAVQIYELAETPTRMQHLTPRPN